MTERILAILTAADPARGVPVAPGDVEALLRSASHDVTNYEPHAPVRRRRVLVAAAAIVAVAAVTGTTAAVLLRGAEQPPADPVVPAPSVVPSCLDRLADSAMTAPYEDVIGPYEYLRTSSTSGSSVQMKNGQFAQLTYRTEIRTWTARDGSLHRRTTNQSPEYADEASRVFFRDNPSLLPHAGTQDEDVPASENSRRQIPAADPAAMAQALYQPRENGPSQAIIGVEDLVGSRILDREHRVALLRFLARTDGILCGAEVSGPAGRAGVVVTGPEGAGPKPGPGEHGGQSILVSPNTGDILAAGYTDATGTNWHTVYLDRSFTSVSGAP